MAATAARIAEVLAGLRAASARLGTAAEVRRAHLPLGLTGLDQALGGGLPRGKLTELTGARSSGRMSIALGAIVQAQRTGELAAIVDVADAFDPRSAHAAGVILPRLLWVRPSGFLSGLQAADRVLDAGGFGLVVVYLVGVPLPSPSFRPNQAPPRAAARPSMTAARVEPHLERGAGARARPLPSGGVGAPAWARLQQRAEKSGAALLLVAEHALAGSFAVATLEARRGDAAWSGLFDGISGTVLVVRSKLGPPGEIVELVRSAAGA